MSCSHVKTYSLYRRASRADGRGFVPDARRCRACRQLLELTGAGSRRSRR